MFRQSLNKYNTDISDDSVHGGVPKKYYNIKNKDFGDWEIPPWEVFIFTDKLIGKGSFSNVYLAKWRETFVVAKIFKNKIEEEKKFLILREIDIMSKLHHPNIVQFLGYIDTPFIIIMEYIPNNNLTLNYKNLYKKEKISIMKDILKGLAYIHNRKPYSLIHRDIKPTNIILTKSKIAKISDFGLSKFYNINKTFSSNNLSNLNSNTNRDNINNNINTITNQVIINLDEDDLTIDVGTERYMAPEIKKSNIYTNKIDIYSCGILLYELFENKPFLDIHNMYWYKTPKKIKNIILNFMLNENPDDRYDALGILKMLNNLNI